MLLLLLLLQFFAAGDYDFVFNVEIGEEGSYKKFPYKYAVVGCYSLQLASRCCS